MLLIVSSHMVSFCCGMTFAIVMFVCMMRSIYELKFQLKGFDATFDAEPDAPSPLKVREIDAGTFSSVDLEILKLRRVLPTNAPHSDTPTGSFPVYSSPDRVERLPVNYVYDGDVAWFEADDDDVAALIPGDAYFVGT